MYFPAKITYMRIEVTHITSHNLGNFRGSLEVSRLLIPAAKKVGQVDDTDTMNKLEIKTHSDDADACQWFVTLTI